jgi:D-ribose pyranase
MLVRGILNPQLASLLARIRHTNTLVIADRGFPFWPEIETVDLSLVDGIPSVPQVLDALLENWKAGRVFMAEEFRQVNDDATQRRFDQALRGTPRTLEPHVQFKLRVPNAIGLIRTGETVQYANMILESA